ncbi:hypothetical protein ABZ330_15370 [Streptomyces sp. NPDC006172]|uniref:ATP-grasp domain-containing protein n=1 Tax=Streptomyces sp. NPDC006172 TaxID=3154470 RepID=UPI0033D8A2B5
MPKILLLSRQPLATRPLHDWLEGTADDIVLLTTPKAVVGAEDALAEHFPSHRLVDDYGGWSTEQAAEEAARAHGVDLVASTSESDVLRAARLRARLGLPGQDVASATAYRDKVVMKRTARAAGIGVPPFAPVECPADLLEFIEDWGFPVVVKPRLGAGAKGMAILRGPAEVTAFLDREPTSEVPYLPGQWMVEDFVTADFFHVDGIMRDGRIVHAWPSAYLGSPGQRVHDKAPLGSVLLAPDDPRTALLRRMTQNVVAALPAAPHPLAFHLEAWIPPDGEPVLCEIASRAGGALIGEAYERAFGVLLAREGLRGQCGLPLELTAQPTAPSAPLGWALLPYGSNGFVPPSDSCPVPGAEVSLLSEADRRRGGVGPVEDPSASVFVEAESAESVRKLLEETMRWWCRNTESQ